MTTILKHPWVRRPLRPILAGLVLATSSLVTRASELVITREQFHLGTPGFPEWEHFAGKTPHGRQLDLRFQATANTTEATLFVRQDDVKYPWTVKLNGRSLGQLTTMEVPLVSDFRVPEGVLRNGENLLSIIPPKNTDDILVGEIVLDPRPFEEAVNQASVSIAVRERTPTGETTVPCRITIADEEGALAPVFTMPEETLPGGTGKVPTLPSQHLAVRTGVVYTSDGNARVGLRPGTYTVYAGRGFEYSVATNRLTVAAGDNTRLAMSLTREVPTEGWVAADCHIHNLTYSGHGDATIDEGMLTIAGEGIELAVATDHNHHTDYTETAQKLKVSRHFTSMVGNEVTTLAGHFNAFPIQPGSSLPDHTLTNWTALMKSIRSQTGAKVIVLNHPRNVHSGFQPTAAENYRQVTGENLRGDEFSFDAIEIVTSAALQSDPMDPIRDWFGLLNHGYRVTGVGSSDTHYVSRMILGQGRSYVRADDRDPASLDAATLVQSYREGRVAVSMGLLANVAVNQRYGMGDLVPLGVGDLAASFDVLAPSWVRFSAEDPLQIEVYVNGLREFHQSVSDIPDAGPVKGTLNVSVPGPHPRKHDFWIVGIATAPGVTAPFWAIPRPYQPSSSKWTPRVIGVTNPVYVDRDGDGKYTPPRGYARQLVGQYGDDIGRLIRELRDYDEAVAAQVASLLLERGTDVTSPEFAAQLRSGAEATRAGFAAFKDSLR